MRDASLAIIREIGVETGRLEHPVRRSTRRTAAWW